MRQTMYNEPATVVLGRKVNEDSDKTIEQAIIEFCSEPRSKGEIARHIGLNATANIRDNYIEPLVKDGKLVRADIGGRSTNYSTYVSTSADYIVPSKNNILEFCATPKTRDEIKMHFKLTRWAFEQYFLPLVKEGVLEYATMSQTIGNGQKYVAARSDKKSWEDRIKEFCSVPRSLKEIMKLVGCSKDHTLKKIIKPLIDRGIIRRTVTKRACTPNQKYVTVEKP